MVDYCGEKISSTAIRQRLLAKDVHEIPKFLGKHYAVRAFWNGYQLRQIEESPLPNVGYYEVDIEFINKKIKTIVWVNRLNQIKIINEPPNEMKGTVKIHWLQHMSIETPISLFAIT